MHLQEKRRKYCRYFTS